MITESVRQGDPFVSAGRRARGPQSVALKSRVERGLDLWRERGHEIEDLGGGVFAVPSQQYGNTLYRVEYGEAEHCGCEDHKFNPHLSCKHLICVGIHCAKMRRRRKNFIASLASPAPETSEAGEE